MNHQKAKRVLRTYRPGGQDVAEPLFAEALKQVGSDPGLQKWFAEEHAFDLGVQAKLRDAIMIPPNLKTILLELRKTARPVPGWRQPAPRKAFF